MPSPQRTIHWTEHPVGPCAGGLQGHPDGAGLVRGSRQGSDWSLCHLVLSPNSITVVTEATPAETGGLPADAPPSADTPAPDRCVLPNTEEGLAGAIPPIDLAFDVVAIAARSGPPAYSRRFG